jgi:hypothetical protein
MRVVLSIATLTALLLTSTASAIWPWTLGDTGVETEWYEARIKYLSTNTSNLPGAYSWRSEGAVTDAKDQEMCAASSAFTITGFLESKALLRDGLEFDFSEQQLLSCIPGMDCCGGSMEALSFYDSASPMEESCAGYLEAGTPCTGLMHTSCGDLALCSTSLNYNASRLYTVEITTLEDTVARVKNSLYWHGPAYLSFEVPSTFFDFWGTASPGDVYHDGRGVISEDRHAVLLIGWSDAKQAWLARNSWGSTGGPNSNGTFWIAYDETIQLGFQVANSKRQGGMGLLGAYCIDAADQHHQLVGHQEGDSWVASPDQDPPGYMSWAMHGSAFGGMTCKAVFHYQVGWFDTSNPIIPPPTLLEVGVEDENGFCPVPQGCTLALTTADLRPGQEYATEMLFDANFGVVRTRIKFNDVALIRHYKTCISCGL